jgi:hypothetical protein
MACGFTIRYSKIKAPLPGAKKRTGDEFKPLPFFARSGKATALSGKPRYAKTVNHSHKKCDALFKRFFEDRLVRRQAEKHDVLI